MFCDSGNEEDFGLNFLLGCSTSVYLCSYSPVAQQPFHSQQYNCLFSRMSDLPTCPHLPYNPPASSELSFSNYISMT